MLYEAWKRGGESLGFDKTEIHNGYGIAIPFWIPGIPPAGAVDHWTGGEANIGNYK